MVHTWLAIPRAERFNQLNLSKQDELPEDGVALAKLDLLPLLQSDKLPPHEGILEWVLVGGDEVPSPVNVQTFGTWYAWWRAN